MNPESGAGLLHRLTSYEPGRDWDDPFDDPRVRHDLVPNDPATIPPATKRYPTGLAVIALPRELVDPGVRTADVLAGAECPPLPLDAGALGRILFLGAGVVRTAERNDRVLLFRAAGSAGARFPLEVYASTRGVGGVPDGVHWYDPVEHALVQVGSAATGLDTTGLDTTGLDTTGLDTTGLDTTGPDAVGPAATEPVTTLVVTGIPWRTGWRYAERGWRHLYWDGGTLLSQLAAAAASAGYPPRLRSLFPDARVCELVGADGVHEYPLALLSLGDGAPAIVATGAASSGDLPAVEFPLCTAAQRAGESDELGTPWTDGPPLDANPASPAPDTLDATIRRRGSQRRMDRSQTLPRALLEWSMAAAVRGIAVPHWVVVHGVDDVPPGLYRWPDLAAPTRAGDLRDDLLRVCLDQYLAADASFVVISAISSDVLDDHSYREAQLAAGVVEGRLHLAAYALGATATGMTFADWEMPALLDPDGTMGELVTLLFTCVGVPSYPGRPGGSPGAPVGIRPVVPRLAGS